MQQFFALFGTSQIKWILILIIVDVILGIIAALVKKNFRLGKLAGFMKKGVLAYVFGFAVLEAVGSVLPSFRMILTGAYFLILLALLGSILNNLGEIGLPISAWFKKD